MAILDERAFQTRGRAFLANPLHSRNRGLTPVIIVEDVAFVFVNSGYYAHGGNQEPLTEAYEYELARWESNETRRSDPHVLAVLLHYPGIWRYRYSALEPYLGTYAWTHHWLWVSDYPPLFPPGYTNPRGTIYLQRGLFRRCESPSALLAFLAGNGLRFPNLDHLPIMPTHSAFVETTDFTNDEYTFGVTPAPNPFPLQYETRHTADNLSVNPYGSEAWPIVADSSSACDTIGDFEQRFLQLQLQYSGTTSHEFTRGPGWFGELNRVF